MVEDLNPEQDPQFFKKSKLWLKEPFFVEGFELTAAQIIQWLLPFVTEERACRLKEVVAGRQLDVFTVLENIYDRGNISAVMRSAEAFGFIRFHIIESEQARFKAANRVTRGADKWVDVDVLASTAASLKKLKSEGIKVYATSLKATKDISDIDFSVPCALVIGNEKEGISDEMAAEADDLFKIEMRGFSQSFNLSVAAALCFYHISRERGRNFKPPSAKEQELLLANYLLRTVENPGQLIARVSAQADE